MTPTELQQWRKQAGLSQSGLAALLGVDHMTVSRWERGVRAIPPYLPLAVRCLEVPRKRPVRRARSATAPPS